jgi:hypothetical protein
MAQFEVEAIYEKASERKPKEVRGYTYSDIENYRCETSRRDATVDRDHA